MFNLETAIEGDCDEAAFSAALFFSILRAGGCNPFVRNNGLYVSFSKSSAAVKDAGTWATIHDPTGSDRLEYVSSVWAARFPGTEVVELG